MTFGIQNDSKASWQHLPGKELNISLKNKQENPPYFSVLDHISEMQRSLSRKAMLDGDSRSCCISSLTNFSK